MHFRELDVASLRRMELRYTASGNSLNGLAVYLRSLRALFNKARQGGVIPKDCYPFDTYHIRQVKTHKSALDKAQLKLLASMELKPGSLTELYHRVFFLSFHLRGMNLKDMAYLKVNDIYEGKIHYTRAKTHEPFVIGLTSAINEILEPYLKEKSAEDFVLPILSNVKSYQAREFDQFQHYQNHALKRWARQLGLPRSLSMNTARHSWATIAKTLGINLATISEGLGHAALRTTQIYLDNLPDSTLDEASGLITTL
jgi:integrase